MTDEKTLEDEIDLLKRMAEFVTQSEGREQIDKVVELTRKETLAHISEEIEKLDLSGVYVYFHKNSKNETNKELLEKMIKEEVLAIIEEAEK